MNNPKPKIYNNDIKVLGRVVSIASENKVAAAEQIFDEKFKYNELPDYSFDNENIDPTRKGLNQYSINRLIGKKVKDIEDAGLLPDEDGFLNNIKIDNLTVKNGATFSGDVSFGDNVSIDKNLTVGNKITTKDLEVTNNAKINKLIVGPGEGIDVYDALTHLLLCCENMNNQGGSGQGGVTLVVSPNPINMNVGDTVEFTVKLNVSGMDLIVDPEINYTASISNTSVATLIGNNKVKAVSGGTTQLTISWNGIQKTVQINVTQPLLTFRVTFYPNNGQDNFHQDVQEGNKLVTVTNPTKTGYTFNGWHKDTESGTVWNFNDVVTSNMSLVAGYTLNEPEQPETHTYQLTLDPTSMNMTVGEETRGIIATRKRDNDVVISDGTINWSSSNTSVATVDQAGTVTAHGQDNATITATWVDPNGETKTATCSVTVSVNIVQPTSLKIVGHENVTVDESTKVATVDVTDGSKTVKFKAVITPNNADTDTEITWTKLDGVGEITPDPNDSSICTYVSLDRSSVCNLKATTANGISDQILIDVVAPEPQGEITYGVTLNKNSETITSGGNGFTLSATLKEFTNGVNTDIISKAGLTITWTSSNTNAATVTASGDPATVTPVDNLSENASTTITVHWTDPNGDEQTATCTVTVNKKPTEEQVYSISAFPTTLNLTVGGESGTVAVTLLPEDEEGLTNWTLRRSDDQSWQNYGSGKTVNVTVEPAAEAGSREITFTATVDEYDDAIDPVTVTVVTSAADTPVQNEHYAIFFDTGLGYNEEDPYMDGEHPLMGLYPNAFELGRTTFQSGSYQRDLERLSEAAAKAASLEHGRDRSGYTLRWDMGLYDTMPDSNIYVKAIWDGDEFTLTYKDGDEVLSTQTLNAGAEITPIQDPTKEGYTFGGWTNMPAAVNNKIYMPAHDLTVTASWSGNYEFAVSPSTLSMIAGEHTQQLGATLNGTNITENVTWSSSDDSIATVNQTGFVTAVAEGTAVVTATTTDERAANKTATCEITVTVRNPELRHSGGQNASPTLFVGESVDFIEEVLDGPEGCRLIWSPENSSVCEVSVKEQYLTRDATETITIKAVGEGTTTITAALVDSEGNAIMAKNNNNQSYAVRSGVINVTVSADPTVKVTWNTDSNASLTNASSQNGVSEFEPITLDNNGDAEYHDWTADVEVENGYKIKDIKVYRIVSGNPQLEDTITDNVSTISITHPTTDMQISITTEAI